MLEIRACLLNQLFCPGFTACAFFFLFIGSMGNKMKRRQHHLFCAVLFHSPAHFWTVWVYFLVAPAPALQMKGLLKPVV